MQPKVFTDEVSVSFRELAEFMNFQYDDFIHGITSQESGGSFVEWA
ncbi:hypothetical protein HET73_03785 [Wolbachia endosymbiont of Atemnus politus]|nr:hypothetical protein [Wolbachia endosymbiont of Atemnus politus]